ncbi:peptidoglycan DD-metalloendopeptidase family protein [Congregibacter sp.]|uniref:peptidoglycan DD-metalloendopeptidase family protein n=1 Tax=Congregibacter sp. TaxID=2744308 RepID=UPI003F6C366F
MIRLAAPFWLLVIGALMVACADKPPAPIEDRSRGGTSRVEQRYTVLPGDTLFSIAFRHGLEFRRLAAANSITAPYTIFPGQKLRLAEAEPPIVATPVSKAAPTVAVKAPSKSPTQPAAASPSSSPAKSSASVSAAGTTTVTKPAKSVPATTNVKVGAWRWPAKGKVTRRFETNLHKGLDIDGKRGDPVIATAGGQIVYGGSGIAGYGLMLIVRHNDEYLSAYGHNDALLVEEGDVVRGGQKIAERGSSGTDSVKLHFEIRRRGRPVDPLKLLPRR